MKEKNLNLNYHYHFIGIGGAGMTPIALIMREKGASVSGSDIAESENLSILRKNNIKVTCSQHNSSNIPNEEKLIIIVSSAISPDNPELLEAKRRGLPVFRRGEFLAKIANSYEISIAVGGSHGKTSITGIITYTLQKLGFDPGYMIGGKITGYPNSGHAGEKFFVCESDESDGTNVFMNAKIAVVSNIDDDHEWNFKGGKDELFANFAKFAANSEYLIYGYSTEAENLFKTHKNKIPVSEKDLIFLPSEFSGFPDFQKINALIAANAIKTATGKDINEILPKITDFPGIERRIKIRAQNKKITLIEDYAHHPAELSALMSHLHKIREGRKIHIIFQPHRYARLKKYFHRFAELLSSADKVIILPIFSAWCPNDELDSFALCKEINKKSQENIAVFADKNFESIAEDVLETCTENTILAVAGAGDCDKLTKILQNKISSL